MALTLRGSGQVSADNYGIDSDGSITTTGITSTGDVAINGVLTTTGLGTTLSSNSYNIVTIQTDKDDTAAADGLLQFTHGSASTVKGEIRYDASESMFELGHGDNQGHVRINNSGYVTTPNQPSFCAYDIQTSSGDIIYGSTWHNEGNHFNTTTGVFTAPITGVYHFSFSALMGNPVNTSHYSRLLWKINGSNNTRYGDTLDDRNKSAVTASGNSEYWTNHLSLTFKLSANDTITVYNGGSQKVYGAQYGHFCGHLVG